MIARLDLRESTRDAREVLPRAAMDVEAAMGVVRPLCEQVRDGGAPAIAEISARLDGVAPPSLRVPAAVLQAALDGLDPRVRAALVEAIDRVRRVHRDQRRSEHVTEVSPGGTVTQRWLPVDRVGLYVPGGRAVYPSSVVMNVVPAQEAGVGSIALASPPQRDHGGWPHPTIMAAAALLGVDEVYAVGGAQAVAMFAYGARDGRGGDGARDGRGGDGARDGRGGDGARDGDLVCRPVDMITGPGNIYVTAAKRLVKGLVGIDSEAGPTEIAILADDSADPALVATDLISQAEHDIIAASVLVTDSAALADAVVAELDTRVPATKHGERIREALAGRQSGIALVRDIEQGLDVVNGYAAEHLEIHTRDARAVARRVRNAGAIFIGPWTPVSLGDYAAGSNHVLPTGGCACHSSGLSVQTFLRGVQLVEYDEAALRRITADVVALANAEDLPAHGEAVLARFPADEHDGTGG